MPDRAADVAVLVDRVNDRGVRAADAQPADLHAMPGPDVAGDSGERSEAERRSAWLDPDNRVQVVAECWVYPANRQNAGA